MGHPHTLAAAALLATLERIVLVDRVDGPQPPAIPGLTLERVPTTEVRAADELAELVRSTGVDTVIELASVDTLACIAAADAAGADYLCTSLERWPDERRAGASAWADATLPYARALLPSRRPQLERSHLVGAGMNPGVVNALAQLAVARFQARRGGEARPTSILITEEDSSRVPGPVPDEALPMTWSPAAFIDEITEPRAMMWDRGSIVELDQSPLDARYRVRCGEGTIDGFVVPHDEVTTIGARHPDAEVAFVYRPLPAAIDVLRQAPEPAALRPWPLYPPFGAAPRAGSDRIGVCVGAPGLGELWLGFETWAGQAARYGTNATLLQVATGVIAGWRQLGEQRGLHTTDDLDPARLVDDVASILGPMHEIDAPDAPVPPLVERRVRP